MATHPRASPAGPHDPRRVQQLVEAMLESPSGPWPCHALVLAARELVALHRAEGEADWTAISGIIGETLPVILEQFEK